MSEEAGCITGTFAGNGTSLRVDLPWEPGLVFVFNERTAGSGANKGFGVKFNSMLSAGAFYRANNASEMVYGATGMTMGRHPNSDHGYFTVGSDSVINGSGLTHHYAAFKLSSAVSGSTYLGASVDTTIPRTVPVKRTDVIEHQVMFFVRTDASQAFYIYTPNLSSTPFSSRTCAWGTTANATFATPDRVTFGPPNSNYFQVTNYLNALTNVGFFWHAHTSPAGATANVVVSHAICNGTNTPVKVITKKKPKMFIFFYVNPSLALEIVFKTDTMSGDFGVIVEGTAAARGTVGTIEDDGLTLDSTFNDVVSDYPLIVWF